jgi:CxxC-x17-CxxC domain-containing protein
MYKMYRESNGGGRFDGPPREMHKVTCAECKKETEVPFKPDGTRPVYCKDCYQKHRPKRF